MNEKTIIVDNPIGLPLASIDDFVLFQGDMKLPITDEALQNLKTSIRDHHVFIRERKNERTKTTESHGKRHGKRHGQYEQVRECPRKEAERKRELGILYGKLHRSHGGVSSVWEFHSGTKGRRERGKTTKRNYSTCRFVVTT